MFLSYIHSFRAVAIIFIVAGHCLSLFEWQPTRWQDQLIASLVPNGTVFFVFVAGFLFQHLSQKFEYRRYLKNKVQNILLPYVIVSLPVILAKALAHEGPFDPTYNHHWPTVAQNVAWSLLLGDQILSPFWYIPMIAVFYLIAPALLWIDRNGRFYYLLPFALTVTVYVHRPNDFDHIWHSCVYFLPIYLYGMWFSRYRDRMMAWHERWLPVLLALVAILAWLEVVYLQRPGPILSASMFSTERGVVGINGLQKLLLCGILLVILRRLDDVLDRKLSYLADVSFGVYFLHMYFIKGYAYLLARNVSAAGNVWLYGLTVAAVVALCVCCLWLAKQVLGRYSRSVVGV